jgi:cytochrome c-type biogenesis protein CcmI
MRWIVLLAAAALAAVAAAGVLWPFGRGRQPRLEGFVDPLDEERLALLRSLRELEAERSSGVLEEAEYRALRIETEARAVSVLRTIEARDGSGELTGGLREIRSTSEWNGSHSIQARPLRMLPAVLVAAAMTAAIVTLLASGVAERSSGEPITGADGPSEPTGDPSSIAFYEERVRVHPEDVAARLDLAQRYLDQGDADAAAQQYLAALELDPDNAEANAELGFLLHLAGRSEEGLAAVDRALAVEPSYPEALYFKGVILLRGLDRPAEAVVAFEAYLEAAPFGARRPEVRSLLSEADSP